MHACMLTRTDRATYMQQTHTCMHARTHTHARTHAGTQASTHARTYARTHTHIHTHSLYHINPIVQSSVDITPPPPPPQVSSTVYLARHSHLCFMDPITLVTQTPYTRHLDPGMLFTVNSMKRNEQIKSPAKIPMSSEVRRYRDKSRQPTWGFRERE